MRIIVASLVVLALAGCLSDSDDTPPGDVQPMNLYRNGVALTATEAEGHPLADFSTTWRPTGYDAREPTLGVTSDGTLFYAARDYSGGQTPPVSATQTPVLRSTDEGRTWEDVSPRLVTGDREPPRSGDPMLVVDPWTDRIFQIELYDLVCNWLVYSDDGGDSWTSNPKACSSLVVDHQTIGAGPSALLPVASPLYENLVYVCVNQIADSHCAVSYDGGLSFGTFHLVYPGVNTEGRVCGGIHGHVLVGPDGTAYLPRQYCGKASVAVSRDDGATWTLMDVGGQHGARDQDPNMAFDAAGNMYYLWIDADSTLRMVWSGDSGATWSEPVRVSPEHLTMTNLPAITAGDDGRIGFSFYGTDVKSEDWDQVVWHGYMGMSHDATATDPTFVIEQASPDPLYRGDCSHQRCGYVREFIDASMLPDGRFVSPFVDACLAADAAKYSAPGDCDTESGDYGQGNGHLGFMGITDGPRLVG